MKDGRIRDPARFAVRALVHGRSPAQIIRRLVRYGIKRDEAEAAVDTALLALAAAEEGVAGPSVPQGGVSATPNVSVPEGEPTSHPAPQNLSPPGSSTGPPSLVRGIRAGLVAAVVVAFIWGLLTYWLDGEIGYLAFGAAAGVSVTAVQGGGELRTPMMAVACVGLSLASIGLGKFIAVLFAAAAADRGFATAVAIYPRLFDGFDILWASSRSRLPSRSATSLPAGAIVSSVDPHPAGSAPNTNPVNLRNVR